MSTTENTPSLVDALRACSKLGCALNRSPSCREAGMPRIYWCMPCIVRHDAEAAVAAHEKKQGELPSGIKSVRTTVSNGVSCTEIELTDEMKEALTLKHTVKL